MNEGKDCARAERKSSQVETKVNSLDYNLSGLGQLIQCLDNKLSPILRDEIEEEQEKGKQEAEILVPLAHVIHGFNSTVIYQCERLRSILDRLEI